MSVTTPSASSSVQRFYDLVGQARPSILRSPAAAPAAPTAPAAAPDSLQLSDAAQTAAPKTASVKVEPWGSGKNDSLDSILKGQGYTTEEIYGKGEGGKSLLDTVAAQNDLRNPNLIFPGQELSIPNKPQAEGEGSPDVVAPSEAAESPTQEGAEPAPQAEATQAQKVKDEVHNQAAESYRMGAMDTLRNEDNATALGALADKDENKMGSGDQFSDSDVNMAREMHTRGMAGDIVIVDGKVDWRATTANYRPKKDSVLVDPDLASRQMERAFNALPDSMTAEQKKTRLTEILSAANDLDSSALEGRIKRNGSGVGFSAQSINEMYTEKFQQYQERAEAKLRAEQTIGQADQVA